MDNFTPLASTLGGLLIGLSATWLLLFHGRIAGISGILAGAIRPSTVPNERSWRALFLLGLVLGGLAWLLVSPEKFNLSLERSPTALLGAGLLVGFGTRLGGGCTSGHGVCGLSRLSLRSLVATVTFMFTAAVTVFVVRQFFGGRL